MDSDWNEMLIMFESLGGIAKNIRQFKGNKGFGICPILETEPIKVFIPSTLLFKTSLIEVVGTNLRITPSSKHPQEFKDFFYLYINNFSWGKDRREDIEKFEYWLTSLPTPILNKLKSVNLLDLDQRHSGPWEEIIFKRFIDTRYMKIQGRKFITPILELMNHSKSGVKSRIHNNGVSLEGSFHGEAFHKYNELDSIQRFLNYGFTSEETLIFSIPIKIQTLKGQSLQIRTGHGIYKKGGVFYVPNVSNTKNTLSIDYLVINCKDNPEKPLLIMKKAFSKFPELDVESIFNQIKEVNRVFFSEISQQLSSSENSLDKEFQKVLALQINSLL